MQRFAYERPGDLSEAIGLLVAHGPAASPLAGGTKRDVKWIAVGQRLGQTLGELQRERDQLVIDMQEE